MYMASKALVCVLLGPSLVLAVTHGPFGQWVWVMAALIRDLRGYWVYGKVAVPYGLLFGDNQNGSAQYMQPQEHVGLLSEETWTGEQGASTCTDQTHSTWICALQVWMSSNVIPAPQDLTHLEWKWPEIHFSNAPLPFKETPGIF